MELVVFDLDGTLLNDASQISAFTRETLSSLTRNGVAYTVATGRNLHSGQQIIADHGFVLPHVYTNGTVIWDPRVETLSLNNYLTVSEATHVLRAALKEEISPWVNTVNEDKQHFVFHPSRLSEVEKKLLAVVQKRGGAQTLPLDELPADAKITNISMLGSAAGIDAIRASLANEHHLISYSGVAMERKDLKWVDFHHSSASKGDALNLLRQQLNISSLICFGDSDNDLSMFQIADECYAPDNAKDFVKAEATAVIGHNNEDGIAHYLRERFNL
ncbi:haloacid dehalogenase [Pseudohongiella acticola]|jgi:5-amino-6-(5-phospho-D-ribitylamino)uracil phosphatase|uniref:Haloacid dehalogenase n=1 Tax=Pseudohongiella acticola TaxID=1524254 RepID=A0A1E8CJ02_9GAMM|nr:Cof-type HAD-IIB family hydrolase [Pseudohongiella acticola]OFE12237.1 haloacid dehalogenase [Pseudohongiella acticola]